MTKLEMLKEIGVGLNCNKSDKQNEEDLKFAMKRSKATIEYAYNIFTKALQDLRNKKICFDTYRAIQQSAYISMIY